MRLCCRSMTRTRLAFALAGLTLALGTGVARAETSAGYDKGFFIKSDNWEIHLGTRTQLQLSTTDPDTFMFDSTLGKRTDTDRLNELNIRRFKFFGSGTIFNPAVKFKFQLDVERFKPGGGSTGNVRFEEAFVDLTEKPWTQLRLGQFKVPFAYEKMTSSGKLNLVDRSIVHDFFGINQEPGVSLYGQSFGKTFRYDVEVSTGVSDNKGYDTRNDADSNGRSDFRYMGRLTWEPLGSYTWEQGAVSYPDSPQLTLQIGGMFNRNTVPLAADPFLPTGRILPFGRAVLGANSNTFPAATDTLLSNTVSSAQKPYDRKELEAVAAFKYLRFAIEGQYIRGKVDPELKWIQGKDPNVKDLNFDNDGLRVQGGFFLVPSKIEIAGRYADVNRKADADFAADPTVREKIEQYEWRAGLNWYFSKHDWKWQFDYGEISTEWTLNGDKLAVPVRSDFPGPPVGTGFDDKLIQNNARKDKEFRTQFQVQF